MDLSVTALSTLRRVVDDGPCRITELTAAEAVAQPSMTALVGRLEARGLLRREPDPADRRAVLVTPTDAGRERLTAVRAARAEALGRRLAALDDPARAALRDALPALDKLLDSDSPT